MEKTQLFKKVGKITANILLYVFIAVCLFSVILTISSKKDADGTASIFGMQMRSIISPSMEKCDATDVSGYEIKDIPVGSMVFIEVVPEDPVKAAEWYADLKVGDVLTFKYVYIKQETITHRITGITQNAEGGYTISLEGDNKGAGAEVLTQTINTAEKNSPNYVIGKVTGQSYLFGLFIKTLKSPAGLVCIVIIPSLIIMLLEILKILHLFGADKRKREQEERAKQETELGELRKRLAELEAQKSAPADSTTDANGENRSI
ncbi:MAG: hypothetical protein IKM42_06925 [Clostridia bacterium]|nr:hypothetical protein [Clostridia bacterium]MBR7111926.1 hypothetical protein [Clostridia bacterium]